MFPLQTNEDADGANDNTAGVNSSAESRKAVIANDMVR